MHLADSVAAVCGMYKLCILSPLLLSHTSPAFPVVFPHHLSFLLSPHCLPVPSHHITCLSYRRSISSPFPTVSPYHLSLYLPPPHHLLFIASLHNLASLLSHHIICLSYYFTILPAFPVVSLQYLTFLFVETGSG